MMVAVIAAISIIVVNRASALQISAAEREMEYMTGLNALDLRVRYEIYLNVITTLAQVMEDYADVDVLERRDRYTEMIVSVMESRPNFVGM
jgi:methyl-accepting chemotaxis protein